jgi:predicted nucleotidyltransferase
MRIPLGWLMNRQQALQTLAENRGQLKRFSVKDLYLFGSVARDEAIDGSDVDILVEFQPDAKIGLFQFAQLQRFLSELLECNVDLATPDALHKDLKEDILKEAIHAAWEGMKLRISDILDAIAAIQEYTAGMNLKRFTEDRKTVDAVARNLAIIGEAAIRIPEQVIA